MEGMYVGSQLLVLYSASLAADLGPIVIVGDLQDYSGHSDLLKD